MSENYIIHLVGQNALQNELFASFLAQATGFQKHLLTSWKLMLKQRDLSSYSLIALELKKANCGLKSVLALRKSLQLSLLRFLILRATRALKKKQSVAE